MCSRKLTAVSVGVACGASVGGRGVHEGLVLPPGMAPQLYLSNHSPHSSRSPTDLGSNPVSAPCPAVWKWARDFASLRRSLPILTSMSVPGFAAPGAER